MSLFFQGDAFKRMQKTIANRGPSPVEATLTRPNNTTAYAAGDVIFPAPPADPPGPAPAPPQIKGLKFAQATGKSSKGTSLVLTAILTDFAAQGTPLEADLYLFGAPIQSPLVDNEPFNPSPDDLKKLLDIIQFRSPYATVPNATIYKVVPNVAIQGEESTGDIYGVLVSRNAYTPVANEQFAIKLGLLPQDVGVF